MNIALVAYDNKKSDMIEFASDYERAINEHTLYATGTTGKLIEKETNLVIHKFQSGPLGGDQQIGALVANDEMDMIIFLRDPLTPQPHEPDVSALMRLCDVHLIPLATNIAAAEIMIHGLKRGDFTWRNIIKEKKKRDAVR